MDIHGRIVKELEDFKKAAKAGEPTVHASTVGDNLKHWKGTIFGPVIFQKHLFRRIRLIRAEYILSTLKSPTNILLSPQKCVLRQKSGTLISVALLGPSA